MTNPDPRPQGPERPVEPSATPWASEYPFESRWLDVSQSGWPLWMHYIDEGPKDAPVLLFLHGNPTWSFIWRKAILALRDRFRCVAVDHVGMGLSDRPYPWTYTLPAHADNVERLLDHLGIGRFVVVAHDWGGMIGMTVATRRPEAYAGGVVMNTAAFLGKLPPSIATVRIPFFGKAAVLGFNAFARAAVVRCVAHKEKMPRLIKDAYLAPYQTPRDRIATLKFVEDVPQRDSHPTWEVVLDTDKKLKQLKDRPMLVLWGEKDWCFTPLFREAWLRRFPDAEVEVYEDASHYVFEDADERVVAAMERFLTKHLLPEMKTVPPEEVAS